MVLCLGRCSSIPCRYGARQGTLARCIWWPCVRSAVDGSGASGQSSTVGGLCEVWLTAADVRASSSGDRFDGGLVGVGAGPCASEGVLQAGRKTLSRFCTATCDGGGCSLC
jgi:hypothetical protein